jgi:hypothetical protein
MVKSKAKKRSRRSKRVKPQLGKGDLLSTIDAYGFEKGMELVNAFGKLFRDQVIPLSTLIQPGNIKIPRETAIFNMSSATDCASLALGLCKACVWSEELQKLKTVCYALKSEREYRPNVLPYRRRQEKYWKDITAELFVIQFLIINSSKRVKFDKIRLNEAGDFHDQECVDKAEKIARLLAKFQIGVYCYTSRDDLDYTKVKTLVINASGFEAPGLVNEFRMIEKNEEWPKGYAKCPEDCTVCDRCSIRGKKTFVLQH